MMRCLRGGITGLTIDIPIKLDGITPRWLSQAFREGGLERVDVADCEVRPFPDGYSATGQLARVSVRYRPNRNGPATVIVKMPDPSRKRADVRGSYQREIRFYKEIGADAGVRVPRLYFGYSDSDSDAAVMLLEDLAPAEPGDSTKGCSYDEAVAAIRGLAQVHARWWEHPRIVTSDWLWSFSTIWSLERAERAISEGWMMLPEDYVSSLPDSVSAMVGTSNWFQNVRDQLDSQPRTLCHPDYRLDNLFFNHDPKGIEVSVIDWGRVGRLRGGFAVAMFLAGESGLGGDEIRSCLEEYWQVLKTGDIGDFSFRECVRDFQLGTLAVLGQRVLIIGAGLNANAPQRIQDMRKKSWDRVVQVVEEFACVEVLDGIP